MANDLSLTKLIFWVITLCVTLIGSLFFYRNQFPTHPVIITHDNLTLFQVPRVIKPFTLFSKGHTIFKVKDFIGHWTILFFGFTHCDSVCPLTLTTIKTAYPVLLKTYPTLQVVFISLDKKRDTLPQISHYVQQFDSRWIGLSGETKELRKLQAQFGIFSMVNQPAHFQRIAANYQLVHSSTLLLINPEARWAGIVRYGLTAKQFIHALLYLETHLKQPSQAA